MSRVIVRRILVVLMGNTLSKFGDSMHSERKERIHYILVAGKQRAEWNWVLQRPNQLLCALSKACYRMGWTFHAKNFDYNLAGFVSVGSTCTLQPFK